MVYVKINGDLFTTNVALRAAHATRLKCHTMPAEERLDPRSALAPDHMSSMALTKVAFKATTDVHGPPLLGA